MRRMKKKGNFIQLDKVFGGGKSAVWWSSSWVGTRCCKMVFMAEFMESALFGDSGSGEHAAKRTPVKLN